MKPFNIDEVKKQYPVIARDGRAAKVLTVELQNEFPILSTVTDKGSDVVCKNDVNGVCKQILGHPDIKLDKSWDLFMNTQTKSAYTAVYSENELPPKLTPIFATKEECKNFLKKPTYSTLSEITEISYEIY